MKKLLAVALMALLVTLPVGAQVVIHQVLYDPLVTDSGGEAVELYNEGDSPIRLEGWALSTQTSRQDASLDGLTIPGRGFLLIADTGWSEKKDNSSWRDADLEDAITLRNAESFVELLDEKGSVRSSVCWGLPDCPLTARPGESLINGKEVFVAPAHFPVVSSAMQVPVTLSAPEVVDVGTVDVSVMDDLEGDGVQVLPAFASDRELLLSVSENVTVTFKGERIDLVYNGSVYNGIVSLASTLAPRNYSLVLESGGKTREVVFEYLAQAALTVDNDAFEAASLLLEGDGDPLSRDVPTLTNVGNVPVRVGVRLSDFWAEQGSLVVEDFVVSIGEETRPGRRVIDTFERVLGVGESVALSVEARPESVKKGAYEGEIFIYAVET